MPALVLVLTYTNQQALSQTNSLSDSIIYLQEVSVYADKDYQILKAEEKKDAIHVSGKGNTLLVSKVATDKNTAYKIEGVKFFFNHKWQGVSDEGFYIKPLLLSSKEDKPDTSYIFDDSIYFIGRSINKEMYIDLSRLSIKITNADHLFVGIEFIAEKENSKFEDFNVTMLPMKNRLGYSYLKGACPNCSFSPFDLDEKSGLTLKYVIYYRK